MIPKRTTRPRRNNGYRPQSPTTDVRQILNRQRVRNAASIPAPALSREAAPTELADGIRQPSNQPPLAPEWAQLNDDLRIGGMQSQTEESKGFRADKPDFWNYAAVGLLGTFYLASLVSTYVSSNLLLYLLSGGAGMAVPMFGSQLPITEAVALMGAGILEGTSLSDAYLEHKKQLAGSRQWMSRGGRFLAFMAQGLLYYMALGQLLFATADVSGLGAQGLEDYQQPARAEASLVLEPPTPLHGVFVGTIAFAWSFGTTYIGSTAVLVSIERLRRKRKQKV